jgi:biotin carboxylase
MKKMLVLGPRHYLDELRQHYSNHQYQLVYYNSDLVFQHGLSKYIKRTVSENKYDGFIGLIDDASQVAAILAQATGKPGPSLEGLLNCQNKYLARKIQHEVMPDMSVDVFTSGQFKSKKVRNISFPLFVKPVRGSMSYFAQEVGDVEELKEMIKAYGHEKSQHIDNFTQIYRLGHVSHECLDTYKELLCEEAIPHGIQVTIDGFSQNGDVGWFGGMTRSVFYPNKISFKRFDFPYRVNDALYTKITENLATVIRASGLDNTLFNIELKIDLDTEDVRIIEINTRASSQFMYPIQVVTGIHPLDIGLDIAAGKTIDLARWSKGREQCSVCVLRREHDAKVISLPTKASIEKLRHRYPGLRVNFFAWPGNKLSEFSQDSRSFRYAEVVIPHDESDNINEILYYITKRLHFDLEDLSEK